MRSITNFFAGNKISTKAILLFCIFILPVALSKAQHDENQGDKLVSGAQLRNDFLLLRNKLEASQPGLHLYIKQDSLSKIFDSILSSLDKPMTAMEFYHHIAPINSVLRNLHTEIEPPRFFYEAMENSPRFPFDIIRIGEEIFILRNNSLDESIIPGTIINSINGTDAVKIFNELLMYTVRDGFNETYPNAQVSRNFKTLYAQHYGTPANFFLDVTIPDGSTRKVQIQGLTLSEIGMNRTSRYNGKYSQHSGDWDAWASKKEPALAIDMKEDVAIMTVRTFYVPIIQNNGQNFENFFSKSFNEIISRKIRHLIIDLRNNHGGSDLVGMHLISHLCDSSFFYYKRRSAVVKPAMKSIHNGDVYEIVGRRQWTGKVTPANEVYTGKVYVLMNGYSVSATAEFIGHLKNMNRAVFIGEETGGNPAIFTGGERLQVNLPHTQITATIPLHLMEMNVALRNTGHGVIPDYEIRPSIDDILAGRDLELEQALELIRKEN